MLTLKNVSFTVRDENDNKPKNILNNINLTIDDNDFVAITGPNGGGKSTLAKIIMGIEKPTDGQILFQGKDITNLSITERAHEGIGFAFQQPVRFKGIHVRDLLGLAAGKILTTNQACAYLSEVGLCALDYVDREVNDKLSGGELKRIEIAMLLARGIKISIFDEPEAGIDLWSFTNLIDVFKKIQKEHNGTVLIITHQERILEIANRIVVIADGQVSTEGARDTILPDLLNGTGPCCFFRDREGA
jgi:Fe-S cluster assembly ATP-binding protein